MPTVFCLVLSSLSLSTSLPLLQNFFHHFILWLLWVSSCFSGLPFCFSYLRIYHLSSSIDVQTIYCCALIFFAIDSTPSSIHISWFFIISICVTTFTLPNYIISIACILLCTFLSLHNSRCQTLGSKPLVSFFY